jgi:hypothetical protein
MSDRTRGAERKRGQSVIETPFAGLRHRGVGLRRGGAPERHLLRLVAIIGSVGIGTAVGAIMGSQGSSGWSIGLVVSLVMLSLISTVQWSWRRL